MRLIRTMQETKLAWLAGVIDGEGCIGIFRKTVKHRSGNVTTVPTPYITIVNSSQALMSECKSILDGLGISMYGLHYSRNETHRPLKRFLIKNHESLEILLDAILPYLVGKKDQGVLLREYLSKYGGKKGLEEERLTYFFGLQELKQSDRLTPWRLDAGRESDGIGLFHEVGDQIS